MKIGFHPSSLILHPLLGIALGLLVSAWYWLPALGEAHLVQLDVQTTGYFNYSGHFRSADLIQSSPGFDYDTEPPHTPFAIGLAQAVAALAGAVTLILTWRRGSIGFRVFTLTGLIISTAMITPLSKPLWDSLPLLPLAQFPWRFLSVQALFASLAIGHLAIVLRGEARGSYSVLRSPCADTQYAIRNTKLATWLTVVLGIMLAASALLPLRPDYLPIRADEITPERIQLYEAFTTNVGTTIRAEYLPRTTIPRPYTGPALIDPAAPPRAIPIRGEVDAEQTARGPISQTWTVRAESDSTLAFPTLYFPGWQASIDGLPVETRATADLGTIEIDVPAGEHAVALSLGRTPLRAGAEIVSLVAVLGLLGMLAFNAVRRRPALSVAEGSLTEPHVLRITYYVSSGRYEIALLALAGILAALATSANTVEARDDNLVMDFESKPWLHHGAADFGAARLVRYEYAERFAAGAPFIVALEWADVAATDATATVQIVAPSLHVLGGPEPLASVSAPIREGVHVYVLDVPGSLPRGTYYLRVDVANASGMEGATFLRPIMYGDFATASDTPSWARIGDAIELKAVYLEHNEPNRLTVAFDWVALKPIAANYAVSLRLQDASGRAWVVFDTQPGYGFQPTSAWLPGENQHDRYTLTLPADMPREATYALDVVWYRVASQQEIGRARVPDVEIGSLYGETEVPPPPRAFDVPPMQQRVDATFGDAIRLLGYDIAQAGSWLTLTLHWQAIADIGADYKFFIHVFDPATEQIVAQVDAMPGSNAYPTSRWVQGEVVSERVELELELESGTYRVATGWYDPVSADRLPALDAKGNPVPADRAILGEDIRMP